MPEQNPERIPAQNPAQIDVAPTRWLGLSGAEQFYPEDLPAEWRLTFYANAFRAAFVPSAVWMPMAEEALADWREDVHAGFRFYLEMASGDMAAARGRAGDVLSTALAALVEPVGPPAGGAAEAQASAPRLLVPGAAGAAPLGTAVRCPPALNADPRGARAWLERQIARPGEAPGLILLTDPTPRELSDWQDLLSLMGLARV